MTDWHPISTAPREGLFLVGRWIDDEWDWDLMLLSPDEYNHIPLEVDLEDMGESAWTHWAIPTPPIWEMPKPLGLKEVETTRSED